MSSAFEVSSITHAPNNFSFNKCRGIGHFGEYIFKCLCQFLRTHSHLKLRKVRFFLKYRYGDTAVSRLCRLSGSLGTDSFQFLPRFGIGIQKSLYEFLVLADSYSWRVADILNGNDERQMRSLIVER